MARPAALFLLLCASVAAQPAFDVIIAGGRIVDGAGNPWFYGDLGIRGDRIARITPAGGLREARSKVWIDGRRYVVAPGFIDIQSQSPDALLDGDGNVISKITQGITTEIMGEGATNAPANEKTAMLETSDEERKAALRFAGPHGFKRWIESMRGAVNFGSFVGATTLRMYGKGMAQGAPSVEEMEVMRAAVREAMEDGAFGIASALIYPPGEYATTEELIELARAMAPYGGVYITHMRSEADRLLDGIDESIAIGRLGGVPVEIYHLKAAGQRNWPKMREAIAKIESARASGLDITADMYPYVAGGTGLTACLPPWAAVDGKLFDNIADPANRARIRAEVLNPTSDWENLCELSTPQGVLIAETAQQQNRGFAGKRLNEIATAMNKDWIDAAMDLILSERSRVETMFFVASEDNLATQVRQPWMKFGTDAGGLNPATATELVHPRAYGTFPRVLAKYVREDEVIPLEDAVRKMTSAVASRLSIPDRGLLREGMFADVVVFDPTTVADRATFENPHQLSVGIRHVFVNGVAVVRDAEVTGALPGRPVFGPGRKQ